MPRCCPRPPSRSPGPDALANHPAARPPHGPGRPDPARWTHGRIHRGTDRGLRLGAVAEPPLRGGSRAARSGHRARDPRDPDRRAALLRRAVRQGLPRRRARVQRRGRQRRRAAHRHPREYNRSIPGALKNALDWASRPSGQSSLTGKPTRVTGASKGAISTALAQSHLKSILAAQGAPLVGAPEVYIRITDDFFTDDGAIAAEGTREFLTGFLQRLHELIRRWQ